MELPSFSKSAAKIRIFLQKRRKVTHFSPNLHHPFTIFSIIYPLSPRNPKNTPPYHAASLGRDRREQQSHRKKAPLRTKQNNPTARRLPSVVPVAAVYGCTLPPYQPAQSHRNTPRRRVSVAAILGCASPSPTKGPHPRRGPFSKASATEASPIRARNDTGGPPSAAHGSCAIRTSVPRCRAASRGRWAPCLPWSHRCPHQPPSFEACRAPGAAASG